MCHFMVISTFSHILRKKLHFTFVNVAVFERIHHNRFKWLLDRQARTLKSERIGLVDLKIKTDYENSHISSCGNWFYIHIKIHVLGDILGRGRCSMFFSFLVWGGSHFTVITGGMPTNWHKYNNKNIKSIWLQIISQ